MRRNLIRAVIGTCAMLFVAAPAFAQGGGGTEEAGRHIGYLTKSLSKSIGQAAGLGERASHAQRDHAHRLQANDRRIRAIAGGKAPQDG